MKRQLLSALAVLGLAAALAQPACARQEAAPAPAAQPDPDSLAWQQRLGSAQAKLAAAPNDAAAARELIRLQLLLGELAAAEQNASRFQSAEFANLRGEVLFARGRLTEAESAFRQAIDGRAPDAMLARLNHAVLLERQGRSAAARAEFERFPRWYNEAESMTAPELTAVGTAVRYLGRTDPQFFHDAVRAYEEAVRADPAYSPALLAEAELFLDKYSSTEAQDLLRAVLEREPGHPHALVLRARAKKFDGSDEAIALVRKSLTIAPEHVPARVFLAELLLGVEDYAGAEREAERALRADPASLEALSVLAATYQLSGNERGLASTTQRALAINPHYSQLYVKVAEMAVQQRRYREAAELARRALALDSLDWGAWTQLGLNQFRLGAVDTARVTLEHAFKGDPFNVWVKNTLDLLDTYPQYVERSGARTRLFLHGDEADLLELYMLPLAEEAIDSLSRRYGYRPGDGVRVEVFPRHADFSVRTVGLTGLGALGVAFGDQLVMDSPAARDRGEFNWGSTLWHELAHTFTLGASRNRVPRWLTEGLSVYEERRARAGWGEELSVSFAQAYAEGRVLPVSRLNEGFVRPQYPEQVIHSYFQASLVVEQIERQHGFDAIRRMLEEYGRGRDNEQVFNSVLKVALPVFDEQFDGYVKRRYARQLEAVTSVAGEPPPYLRLLQGGRAALEAGDTAGAIRQLEQARDAFPEHASPGSPYHLLADLHERAGRGGAAAAELERAFAIHDSDYDAMIRAAALRLAAGDTARAAAALERALYVHPYDPQLHERLALLYDALGRHPQAVRERRAVLALAPVDMAEARYQLARALERAGDRAGARAEVLRALEVAPNFAAAQELLLRVSGGGS